MSLSAKQILYEHGAHQARSDIEFYCVAHEQDYSPKYLDGDICHDSGADGYCLDECRICSVPCPHEPCPFEDDDVVGEPPRPPEPR